MKAPGWYIDMNGILYQNNPQHTHTLLVLIKENVKSGLYSTSSGMKIGDLILIMVKMSSPNQMTLMLPLSS